MKSSSILERAISIKHDKDDSGIEIFEAFVAISIDNELRSRIEQYKQSSAFHIKFLTKFFPLTEFECFPDMGDINAEKTRWAQYIGELVESSLQEFI